MNVDAKQAYLDKMNAQLAEWRGKIDVVKARIDKGSAQARIGYHEQLESWKKKEPIFKSKLKEIRAVGADGFEAIKSGAETVWGELNAIITSLQEKKN